MKNFGAAPAATGQATLRTTSAAEAAEQAHPLTTMPTAATPEPEPEPEAVAAEGIAHLELYGWAVLDGRIPRQDALALGADLLALHDDPRTSGSPTPQLYDTMFGQFERDERTWSLAMDPAVRLMCEHFLGEYRIMTCNSKPSWPGYGGGGLHTDIANAFRHMPPPQLPWILNTIWMLSDFTETNGATLVVPFSHGSQRAAPTPCSDAQAIPVVGGAGSVLVFHPALFHGAGPNTAAADVRVGLNIGYHAVSPSF